jgi:hypothetical protein
VAIPETFRVANFALLRIFEMMTTEGQINVDVAELRSILTNRETWAGKGTRGYWAMCYLIKNPVLKTPLIQSNSLTSPP